MSRLSLMARSLAPAYFHQKRSNSRVWRSLSPKTATASSPTAHLPVTYRRVVRQLTQPAAWLQPSSGWPKGLDQKPRLPTLLIQSSGSRSGIEPSGPPGVGHAGHRHDRRRLAHGPALGLRQAVDLQERPLHDLAQADVDLLLRPEERLQILDPLEVGNDHATGVRHDVGKDQDVALVQRLVGGGCGRAVGALGHDAGPDRADVG